MLRLGWYFAGAWPKKAPRLGRVSFVVSTLGRGARPKGPCANKCGYAFAFKRLGFAMPGKYQNRMSEERFQMFVKPAAPRFN